jgi:hypothetical protein
MTSGKNKLDNIDDFILAETLATPDDEITAEVGEEDIAAGYADLEKARAEAGKRLFAEAKSSLERSKHQSRVVPIDREKQRAKLAKLIEEDPDFRGKLTLAARKRNATSDDDDGLLDDLAELEEDLNKKADE